MITLKDKLDTLQETSELHTPNEEYKNFVTAHIEAAEEGIPTKQKSQMLSSMV